MSIVRCRESHYVTVLDMHAVLVTLWASGDEATMIFMKNFYQHLKEGNTANGALRQSLKSLRDSAEYSEMRQWAPFQFIGDNVKIAFETERRGFTSSCYGVFLLFIELHLLD